jgi:hypothetical protein
MTVYSMLLIDTVRRLIRCDLSDRQRDALDCRCALLVECNAPAQEIAAEIASLCDAIVRHETVSVQTILAGSLRAVDPR